MNSRTRFLFSLLFPLYTFCSCASRQELPRHHLPAATMEQVLLDMQLADVYSTMSRPDSLAVNIKDMDSLAYFYTEIFRHHGITQEAFLSSMEWYEAHPDELDKIYARIADRLTVMSGEGKE